MKLTINIVTDESGTMTATVPEVPGLVVEADDLGEIFAEITDLVPEMTDFDFVSGRVASNARDDFTNAYSNTVREYAI